MKPFNNKSARLELVNNLLKTEYALGEQVEEAPQMKEHAAFVRQAINMLTDFGEHSALSLEALLRRFPEKQFVIRLYADGDPEAVVVTPVYRAVVVPARVARALTEFRGGSLDEVAVQIHMALSGA